MARLPEHGRIQCNDCYEKDQIVLFDKTKRTEGNWRITANPMAWGNSVPEIVVLGFSKGPTQAGVIDNQNHNDIAFKGGRLALGKILRHIGLLTAKDNELSNLVDQAICNKSGRFHFGSLIRCTVERFDNKKDCWTGTGGDMLGKFTQTNLGNLVVSNCSKKYLSELPDSVKVVVMLGMGAKQNYIHSTFKIYQQAKPGKWIWINEVAYTNGKIVVVHVEHFKSQGALIPQWLSENKHPRGAYGLLARQAVAVGLQSI